VSTVGERVALGAAFLDQHDPEWWRADVERPIDLAALDLASGSMCVLGQRCPRETLASFLGAKMHFYSQPECYRYSAHASRLRLLDGADTFDCAHDLGFDDDVAGDDPDDDGSRHAALTDEWRRVITERREGCR
jgi:hypothetical protein